MSQDTVLEQILLTLKTLGEKQDDLAKKVEAISLTHPSPLNISPFKSVGITDSIPPSPVVTGIDHIPCGPSRAPISNTGTSPKSDNPLATRSGAISPVGGGVEALNWTRRTSFPTSPKAATNGTGTSTPYGNLSLAAAAVGAGAPGPLSPVDKGEKGGHGEEGGKEKKALYPSRVVLTTYPSQAGVNPIPVHWGAGPTGRDRGPVVCSRIKSNLPIRNSIGAHSGSYSIFRSLSIAMGQLRPDWRPDLTNTHPPFVLPPQPGWFGDGTSLEPEHNKKGWKIVTLDPWGAMSQELWAKEYAEGLDVRPTIAQTKAHIKIEELDTLARKGEFSVDGEIVIKSPELAAFPGVDQGVEINCYKAAIDPVWYLPGVAERLGIEESTLRRALFEDTGGMYPELLTRPDIKIFLPPIAGTTIYIMGDPSKLSNPETEVTCRPHDSCSGSDVFGSDICTCRPYLIFGISEAIKCAQRGGVGVIAYFNKEGRSLGEVVKYMVYNRRKRGGDNAAEYFDNTVSVAGVKDARHQDLMPDVLHFLGIKRIDNLISMSNLKYDAIVGSGIEVVNR
ncbi:cyclohydrolase [Tremella mesenterica]|uniref:Cyclohydrolase n=1 Tax=Tremella mesenterica TaxID=5217 RepID=A0A4Q1BHF1_TREME|nr:cyclohydrolase [Tremella mesenterica]